VDRTPATVCRRIQPIERGEQEKKEWMGKEEMKARKKTLTALRCRKAGSSISYLLTHSHLTSPSTEPIQALQSLVDSDQ
jgi:hypothetical protein